MTVLTPTNAFPGAGFPQHLSGKTNTVQDYRYPGAVQPLITGPAVLSTANAFPGVAYLQHLSGKTNTVQNYLFPGIQPAASAPPPSGRGARVIFVNMTAAETIASAAAALLWRNPLVGRRRLFHLLTGRS